MAKKKLTSNDYWAQYIVRTSSAGKDYMYALVRRKYSDDDIEAEYLNQTLNQLVRN